MLISAGLVAAVLLRGADGAIKYSLDKTGRELLFLPVPLEVKKKTKVFIDVLVDRWFRGVAGGLLLFCVWMFGFDGKNPLATMPLFSAVVIGLLLIWIVMALVMRREYVNTFRKALERRTIDPAEIRIDISESATLKTLVNSLHASNSREIAYALNMLESVRDRSVVEHVAPLLSHAEADIRKKALSVLKMVGDSSLRPSIEVLLQDSDPDVRREAFHFMYLMTDDREDLLDQHLSHKDPALRCSAVAAVAEYGSASEKRRIDVNLVNTLLNEKENPAAFRAEVAHALGHLTDRTELKIHLQELLSDSSPAVLRAALAAAGKHRDREFLPKIISRLADTHVRSDARRALVSYGTAILGTLNDYLLDAGVDPRVRRNIPRVLADIAHQQSVHILTSALAAVPPEMKYHLVKALNKMRSKYPELSFDERMVDQALIAETRSYYETIQILHLYGRADDRDEGAKLLRRALTERLDQNLERIFRLLGLSYPPNDIYSAYLGIRSDRKELRDSAVEFLDNLLHGNLKRYLLPIVDHVSVERTVQEGRHLFGVEMRSRSEALHSLITASDPWLRACAIYAAGEDGAEKLVNEIEEARNDPDSIVRETADLVFRRISASNREGT
jgi:HEAT repeat protein